MYRFLNRSVILYAKVVADLNPPFKEFSDCHIGNDLLNKNIDDFETKFLDKNVDSVRRLYNCINQIKFLSLR